MNNQIGFTEITYTKDQIERLKSFLDCNGGKISSALSVAVDERMWTELEPETRCCFIAEMLERIKEGKAPVFNEPEKEQHSSVNI